MNPIQSELQTNKNKKNTKTKQKMVKYGKQSPKWTTVHRTNTYCVECELKEKIQIIEPCSVGVGTKEIPIPQHEFEFCHPIKELIWMQQMEETEINFLRLMQQNMEQEKEIMRRFRCLYFSIKYKKQFRKWLWERVRLPKIQQQFHPSNCDAWFEDS